jgi:hypothetical protein
MRRGHWWFAFVFGILLASGGLLAQQQLDSLNRERARQILRDARECLKKNYYDPKFHDLDLDARYKEFDQKIQSSTSLSQAYGFVAGYIDALNDSHTFFNPPSRPFREDAGFEFR